MPHCPGSWAISKHDNMLYIFPTVGNFPLASEMLSQATLVFLWPVHVQLFMFNVHPQTVHLSKLYMIGGYLIFSKNAEKGIVLTE